MSDNLKLWDALQTTDPDFTQKFDNGTFSGVSVNATYNIKRVTEQLGPVGQFWGWHIVNSEFHRFDTPDGDRVTHILTLRVWFRQKDGTERYVDSIGTTPAAYPTKTQKYVVDNDAAKKSLTDALSKAMMALGASADIWLKYYDDRDYVRDLKDEKREREREPANDPRSGREEGPANGPDPERPLNIVDPSGKKPASRVAFGQAASALEAWANKKETTFRQIEALVECNREELLRINGLVSALMGIAEAKEGYNESKAA